MDLSVGDFQGLKPNIITFVLTLSWIKIYYFLNRTILRWYMVKPDVFYTVGTFGWCSHHCLKKVDVIKKWDELTFEAQDPKVKIQFCWVSGQDFVIYYLPTSALNELVLTP